MPTTIYDVLDELKKHSTSEREKGDRFEQLIKKFLQTDPKYQDLFSHVWLWNDWPDKNKMGDTGIDLVAKEREGEGVWAVQCKFYDQAHHLQKSDICGKNSTSSREFRGVSHFSTALLTPQTVTLLERRLHFEDDNVNGNLKQLNRMLQNGTPIEPSQGPGPVNSPDYYDI